MGYGLSQALFLYFYKNMLGFSRVFGGFVCFVTGFTWECGSLLLISLGSAAVFSWFHWELLFGGVSENFELVF